MHVDSTATRVNYFHNASSCAPEDASLISLSCVLPLASMASLYDNLLCRPASRPNYFSGLHSANKSHGHDPSRILQIYALSPARVIFILRCPPSAGGELLCVNSFLHFCKETESRA